jgi:hypothetical protein
LPSEGGGPFGPLSGGSRADAEVSDRAVLQAMLDAERALAVASARVGIVPGAAAAAIAGACRADRFDPDDLGRRALAAGNPVVPLVRDLTGVVEREAGPEAARWVHHGATSQDILDTAASLVAFRALGPILDDLDGAAGGCARLADAHRDTVMAARTLGQQALPTTFGLKAAGWLAALDEAAAGLDRVRREGLAAQLGGPAGTLASLGPAGVEVAAAYAEELGDTVIDLALQGMGPDGHTASLFPGHPQLHATGVAVCVPDSPKPPPERMTLTLGKLNEARRILMVVTGEQKAAMLARVFAGPDPEIPASLLARDRLEIVADAAALG